MSLVQNYKVSSVYEARDGLSNDSYMTPWLASYSIRVNAIEPLDAHVADTNNPHGDTAALVGTLEREVVATTVNAKYNDTERVASSTYANFKGNANTAYASMLAEFRRLLPPVNFTQGIMPPQRIAHGAPNGSAIVVSSNDTWTQFASLISSGQVGSGIVTSASFGSGYDRNMAANFIRTTSPYKDLPNGSIVFFKIYAWTGSWSAWANGGASGNLYRWSQCAIAKVNGTWSGVV